MALPLALLAVIAGIAILGYGADVLVRGAVVIARIARMSPAIIGLTIVSMGTSLPELTVSLAAALRGSTDLGLGNVVGSNIFNVAVVVGATALLRPLSVHSSAIRLEWPFMFFASFQLLLLARDGSIDRLEGAFFLASLVAFTAYVVRLGRTEVRGAEASDYADEVARQTGPEQPKLPVAVLLVAAGVALLVVGGEALVRGAVSIARSAGMSERVIGLTIVAAGTGTPEVATSLMAARRGEGEMALGNVIGSNIFNILGILGITALVQPLAVGAAMVSSDLVWMLGFSLLLFPMMRSRAEISRGEGTVLILGYVVYLALLVRGG